MELFDAKMESKSLEQLKFADHKFVDDFLKFKSEWEAEVSKHLVSVVQFATDLKPENQPKRK